jgi:type III pantothenate kinase
MILAIDIGNTNIVMGCIDSDRIYFEARLSTNHTKTYEQYAVEIKNILELYDVDAIKIDGCILSCVVPPLTTTMSQAIELVTKKKPLIVGPGLKTGLNIMTDNPGQLGSDLVVGAVAALAYYKAPIIIFDLGTATTVSVIDENKTFLGGAICPGVNVSLEALIQSTSQLPKISLDPPLKIVGGNTVDCMRSGIVFGNASMMDGLIERIEQEIGHKCIAISTGGLAALITPYCKYPIIHDPQLMLKGLMEIYQRNMKNNKKL